MFHVMRCPDTEAGGQAAEPAKPAAPAAKSEFTRDEWYDRSAKEHCVPIDLCKHHGGVATLCNEPLTVAVARMMLGNACAFLNQVVALASGVLDSINVGQLRDIVGDDLAIPAGVIRGDQTASLKETPPKADLPDRDGRKNPRGRKHPLVALIELAAKAAKLLEKIATGLTPQALDREPLASRQQARADALDQKREASTNSLFR